MFDKLHIVVTLIAAVIDVIFCIFSDKTLSRCVLSIIITIILFFIIGCIAKHYAVKWFDIQPPEEEEKDENENQEELTEAEEEEEIGQALNSR